MRTVFVSSQAERDAGPLTPRSRSPPPTSSRQNWTGSRPDGPRPATAGRRIHAHAGTAAAAGGEVAELGRRGLLGPDVTLSHCTRLSDADFDAIAASSTAVALTPASDMAGGVGPPPVQQLIDRGIRPGLGVGDERLAPGDVFAQMRAVISVQHATSFDLKLAGKGGVPNLLGTRDVIRYATVDGARVAGLADITGSLSPGKRADVIVLRADRPNIAPVNDPIGAVVWGMDTSNIDWVFVGGAAAGRERRAHRRRGERTSPRDGGPAAGRRQRAGLPAGAGARSAMTASDGARRRPSRGSSSLRATCRSISP